MTSVHVRVFLLQARHDFEIVSSLPTRPRLDVETFEGRPIDIELPSSASGQHVVNFKLWVALPNRGERTEGKLALQAEMTLPVHLRYPDLGCQHRGEECSAYEWVQVSWWQMFAVLRMVRGPRVFEALSQCLVVALVWWAR